ncbi:MAG: hypothetical protein NT169_24775 [Chloroflexi bacterium]|nr:hypothetical protein [Chloroflexota bacterium]
MSLEFKRNHPMILLLLAILCFLTFVMGDQPIIAYTVKAERQQAGPLAAMGVNLVNDVARPVGLSITQTADAGSQIAHANGAFDVNPEAGKGE